MKIMRIATAVVAGCVMTTGVSAAGIFSIQTDLPVYRDRKECAISVPAGEVLEFSAADLERRLEMDSGGLGGITVTGVPEPTQGTLVLEGIEVERYDFIGRDQLDQLCFVPNETAASASIAFTPQGVDAVPASLQVSVLAETNLPPCVEAEAYTTAQNMSISGFVTVKDPEGDAVSIQVVRPPRKGRVRFSGCGFTYTPFQGATGDDSFQICAVDRLNNYSAETTIDVHIEKQRDGFAYADMTGNPSEYAAVRLAEKGVYSGEQFGQSRLFHPGRQMSRLDYLLLLLAASGKDGENAPTVNTRLPNDGELPVWSKLYISRAVAEGIWDKETVFKPYEVPTRAEAVVMAARAAGIDDVKDFELEISDRDAIPSWALDSYKELAAYKMLDLYDGAAYPDQPLQNSYGADLAWQLYKHCHR